MNDPCAMDAGARVCSAVLYSKSDFTILFAKDLAKDMTVRGSDTVATMPELYWHTVVTCDHPAPQNN